MRKKEKETDTDTERDIVETASVAETERVFISFPGEKNMLPVVNIFVMFRTLFSLSSNRHYYVPYASRRFYLFGPHNGCEYDWVYTMAMDFPVDTCISHGLWHISIGNVPNLFYSPSPTGRASFRTDGGEY